MITCFRVSVEEQLCYGAVKLAHICCGGLGDRSLFRLHQVQVCAGAESQSISVAGNLSLAEASVVQVQS